MTKEIKLIKQALLAVEADSGEAVTTTPKSTVTEDAPLLPYHPYSNKPKGLPIEEYSLKPAGDLRRVKPIADQLEATTTKLKVLDEEFTNLRVDTEAKIKKLKKDKGYEEAKTELTGLSERAVNEIQRELTEISQSYGESKKILLEYQNRVYAIYDEIKDTTVSDKERLDILNQSMAKLLSPELVKSVTDLVNQAVSQIETAKREVKRKLVSWEPSDKIRKQVKEELPKKVESLQVRSDISSMLSSLWQTIKGLFSPIKDTAAELQALLETEVEPLLEAPVTAAKVQAKTAGVYRTWLEENVGSAEDVRILLQDLRDLMEPLSHDDAQVEDLMSQLVASGVVD